MKCNPIRWLWGLVPLLGLGGLMYLSGAFTGIEADLKQRTEKELAAREQGWATVVMSGRDATLIGEAVDNSDQLRASGIVRSVWNVRKLDDQTKLLDEEKNYVWGAQLQADGKVRLSGFVPSPASRQTIVDAAKTTFPSRFIDDRMKLARGAPPQAQWEGGIGFALKQLAALKPGGRVDLDAANLLIEGEAEDLNAFKSVKTALQTTLPQGVRLRSDKVTPPVVKPYTWAAKLAGNQVQLSGHVPSERARDEIFAAAKKAFPKAAVVDRLQIAAGEPKDWLPSVLAVVAKLGRLEEGTVDIRDAQLSLAGLAPDEATASDIKRGLKSDLPASFKTTEALRIKELPLKTIDPFTTGITAANGVVALSGFVPSPIAKAGLLESTKARLPGQRIEDKLEIANGAPESWLTCAQSGLLGLGRLGAGRVQMTGRTLTLTGQTDSEPLSQGLAVEVQNAAGQACASDVRVAFTGIPTDELKRRAEAAAARAAAEEAARKAAAEAAAAKAVADAAAAKAAADAAAQAAADEAARKAVAAATQPAAPPAPPPTAPVAVAPPTPVAAPPTPLVPSQSQAEAINCQTLLTQVQNEGVINFKRASAELDRQSNVTLDKIAGVMATCTSARIEVQGHTDAEGTPERNINLSNRRAQSVLEYLSAAGVEPARLTAVGYGETRPIAPNDTRENRAKNRRIEFEVRKE
jgi:OmpA-OmpF porin, OOP family